MKLEVDSREPPEIQDALRQWIGAENVKIKTLAAGDVRIKLETGVALVERKTPSDLVASIADGRLFRQASAMAKTKARFPVLVIDGDLLFDINGQMNVTGLFGDTRSIGWTAASVKGALLRVQMLGVLVYDSYPGTGAHDFPRQLEYLCEKFERADAWHIRRREPVVTDVLDAKRQAHLDALGGLGVGVERAASLMEKVGESATLFELLAFAVNHSANERPPLWGPVSQQNLRDRLGLRAGQILDLKARRKEWQEFDSQEKKK